jgi:O-antigen/teichoic acid export membrane protein
MNRLTLIFLAVLVGVLVLAGVAVLLWRRFYRDDATNIARRVFKNSAVTFGTRMLVRGFDLIFAIILYSTLPGDIIGRYTFAALLVPQFLGTITEFGLSVLLTREVAREPQTGQTFFGVTLLLRLLLVAAAFPLAGLLIGGYALLGYFDWGEAISPPGQQVIWILMLTLLPGAYSNAVTALYNAAERMEVPAMIELVTAVLSFLLRLAALALGFGILGLAWAAVLTSSITALVYLGLQVHTFFRPRLQWDGHLARRLFWLALPLMLNNLLGVVFFRIDTLIIKAFGGGEGDLLVQQYNIAYQVLSIALIVPPAVTFAVFPMLSRQAEGDRATMAATQNRTLYVLLLLAFPIAMGLTVLAPALIWFFARDNAGQYLPISAHVLALLAWFLPLSFANGLLQYALIAVNRQHAITRAFVAGATFNLLANLLAVPAFGLYAASITTILSEAVLFIFFLPLLRAEGLAPPLLALAWRPALAAGAMGGAMLLAGSVGWWAAVLVSAPIYIGALWLLGGIGPEEIAFVRRIAGRSLP